MKEFQSCVDQLNVFVLTTCANRLIALQVDNVYMP